MAYFDPEKMAVRGFVDLVDQIRRSATSITANVLEAGGEWRPGKRAHYFMIAKGSAWETWAHTDSFVDVGLIPEPEVAEVRALQNEITALLITSIRNLEDSTA